MRQRKKNETRKNGPDKQRQKQQNGWLFRLVEIRKHVQEVATPSKGNIKSMSLDISDQQPYFEDALTVEWIKTILCTSRGTEKPRVELPSV